jgi:hypothetical protein
LSYSHRWSFLWILAGLLCAGCSGATGTVSPPEPSGSPAPPATLGRGTVAVIDYDAKHALTRILILPPHSDKFTREITIHTSRIEVNSAAFDRRGHLYVGINDPDAKYEVLELNAESGRLIREITNLPPWPRSSVATDDENFLYVNTKAFVGGDVKLFRPGDTKPWLEIKDSHSPVTITVARGSLWVGYEGLIADAVARYRLRSRDQTGFQHTVNNLPVKLEVNPEASLIAAKFRRDSKVFVAAIDVKSGKRTEIHNGGVEGMASDDSGHLYLAESNGKIQICTFHRCTSSFETHATVLRIAANPLDGMLYVAASGKPSLQIYDPRNGQLVKSFPLPGGTPRDLAVEP